MLGHGRRGVDALIGAQTRGHHDLDVLVVGEDVPALAQVFRDQGFGIKQVWEAENRWVNVDGTTLADCLCGCIRGGRGVGRPPDPVGAGVVVPLCNVAWPLDVASFEGRGVIGDRPVDCVSARTQVAMHRGYHLPEAHQRDLDLLRLLS